MVRWWRTSGGFRRLWVLLIATGRGQEPGRKKENACLDHGLCTHGESPLANLLNLVVAPSAEVDSVHSRGHRRVNVFLLFPAAKTQTAPGDLMADQREAPARQAGLDLLAIQPG